MFLRPTPLQTRSTRDPEKEALRCSAVGKNARSFAVFDRTASGPTNRWLSRLVSPLVGLLSGPYYGSINTSQWIAEKTPHLTDQHRRERLAFCLANRNRDWSRVIFPDECSVEQGKGKKRSWVWGDPRHKWDHDMIETFSKGKQACAMVWGAICEAFTGSASYQLVVMKMNLTAKNNGYTAWAYQEALIGGLLPEYRKVHTFVQDNASIHTAGITRIWLRDHFIPILLNWPPL
jgi:hypothetical protein